jgi:hypothetical protein
LSVTTRRSYVNSAILMLASTTYFLLNYFLKWPILAGTYLGAEPKFLDLHQTFQQVECVEAALNQEISFNQGAVECGYVYSRPLYFFVSWLDLQPQNLVLLGLILGLLLVWFLAIIAHIGSMTTSIQSTLVAALLICSPPIMLLFERANVDTVIFLLVIAAAFAVSRGYKFYSLVILVICTLIKFYTLPIVWILWALMEKWKRATLLVPLLLVSLYVTSDLLRTAEKSPYPTDAAFGNAILGKYLQSGASNRLIDFFVGIATVVLCWVVLRKLATFNSMMNRNIFSSFSLQIREACFWLFSAVFISCYLPTSNWDYRLVFLLGQILILWSKLPELSSRTTKIVAQFLLIASMWLSFSFGIVQVLGDVAIGVLFVTTLILWKQNWKSRLSVWQKKYGPHNLA